MKPRIRVAAPRVAADAAPLRQVATQGTLLLLRSEAWCPEEDSNLHISRY